MSFSTIFCCGTDSRDDSDENKYINHSHDNLPVRNESNDTNLDTLSRDKKKKDTKDPLDFDDNSINETETIANTNEEPTPTSLHFNSENPINTKGSSSKQTNDTDEPLPPKNNVTDHVANDQANNDTRQLDDVVIAQQTTNENAIDLDLQNLDEESLLDLTMFQEGQYRNPETGWLLGKKSDKFKNRKCLVLDLDETLVHSSFKYLRNADFVIPVEIENQIHHVYVIKRPGVDEYLRKVSQWYEVVVFTASVLKYGDPLLDKLDIYQAIHHRLFRDSCYTYENNFIKNLSQIGRPLNELIIIDNSPASYIFHPQHSVPISSWFSDTHDNELLDLLPLLEDLSKANVDDVSLVLDVML